ncbi:MAG: F0F1 ATP synthase subunit epsilon, partial [Actinobacteria bacterium]|nr:F0F1 ATP synthase subunit epsilon [Actinomycetota bacterium]
EGVKILSDVAELGTDIDVVRARTAMEAAEAALRSDPENVEAKQALQRASVRLDAAGATPSA